MFERRRVSYSDQEVCVVGFVVVVCGILFTLALRAKRVYTFICFVCAYVLYHDSHVLLLNTCAKSSSPANTYSQARTATWDVHIQNVLKQIVNSITTDHEVLLSRCLAASEEHISLRTLENSLGGLECRWTHRCLDFRVVKSERKFYIVNSYNI